MESIFCCSLRNNSCGVFTENFKQTCRQDICRNFVLQFARDLAACMESLDILISKGQYVFVELKARIVLDFITARKLV